MCSITITAESSLLSTKMAPQSCQEVEVSTSFVPSKMVDMASSQISRPLKKRRLDCNLCSSSDCGHASSSSIVSLSSTTDSVTSQPILLLTKPTKRRRSNGVSFSPSVDVQTIPRWTPEENTASWYNALDIHLFKLQEGTDATLLRHVISSASAIDQLPQDTSIYRGLERLLSEQITNEIKERRKDVVKHVLTEQYEQDLSGVDDSDRIAYVSRQISEKATVWAVQLGSLV